MMNVIFSMIFVVSIILLVVTVILIIRGTKKISTHNECNGTIVKLYENSVAGVVRDYETVAVSPIVNYEVDGKTYEFIGNYYSTSMQVGQTVRVLYDPKNPSIASIKNGIFFAPIVTGTLTVVFLTISVVYFIVKINGIIN